MNNGAFLKSVWVLLTIASFLCFWGSNKVALFDTDEPRYAQTAKEMLQRGDYILPTFNGQPRYAKPIFFYWLLTLAYKTFGINEFSTRFWSGLSAIAIALVLFFGLRLVWGDVIASLSALCWLTSVGCQLFSHAAITDMVLVLFMTIATLWLWLGMMNSQRSALFIGFCASGLAVLTKGPIGLALPALIVLITLSLTKGVKKIGGLFSKQRFALICGAIIFTVIVLPWYVAITIYTDGEFIRKFLLSENVGRYAEGQQLPFLVHLCYYPVTLWALMFPWSAVGVWMIRFKRFCLGSDDRFGEWQTFLSVWTVLPIVVFTFSSTKNPQYVLLSAPALASLSGLWLIKSVGRSERRGRWFFVFSALMAGGLLIAIPFAINLIKSWHDRLAFVGERIELGWGIWAMVLVVMFLPIVFFLSRPKMALVVSASMIFFFIFGLSSVIPAVDNYRQQPIKHFAQEIAKRSSLNNLVIVYRRDMSGVVFYIDGRAHVIQSNDVSEVCKMLKGNSRVDIITKSQFIPELLTCKQLHLIERQHNIVWLSNKNAKCSLHSKGRAKVK